MMILRKLNVKKQLILGFSIVLLVMVAVSVNNYIRLEQMQALESDLLDVAIPTVSANAQIENGVSLSLAGLRGYMILGYDPAKGAGMKKARASGWQEIDAGYATLRELSSSWKDQTLISRLDEMGRL